MPADLGIIRFKLKTGLRVAPTAAGLLRLGREMVAQIKRRFANHGPPDGPPWKEKWVKGLGRDDGRAVLTGSSAHLATSWEVTTTAKSVTVYSEVPYAHVHQLGTTKYGGPIPTIRPVRAKALFIPLSDRARTSLLGGGRGVPMMRIPTRGKKLPSGEFAPLKKGRIKYGHTEVWNPKTGKWTVGKPDFIFLMKSDIPQRPMLPNSRQEQEAQGQIVLASCMPKTRAA